MYNSYRWGVVCGSEQNSPCSCWVETGWGVLYSNWVPATLGGGAGLLCGASFRQTVRTLVHRYATALRRRDGSLLVIICMPFSGGVLQR